MNNTETLAKAMMEGLLDHDGKYDKTSMIVQEERDKIPNKAELSDEEIEEILNKRLFEKISNSEDLINDLKNKLSAGDIQSDPILWNLYTKFSDSQK